MTQAKGYFRQAAESGSSEGKAAFADLLKLDLPGNAGAYLDASLALDGKGQIQFMIQNNTPFPIGNIVVEVSDNTGSRRMNLNGVVQPNDQGAFNMGVQATQQLQYQRGQRQLDWSVMRYVERVSIKNRKEEKLMKHSFEMVMVTGLVMLLSTVVNNALAQGEKPGGKHFGTVERKAAAPASTTSKGEPCVIDLTAPKKKGHCELGPSDPPAKVLVKGWYAAELTRIEPHMYGNLRFMDGTAKIYLEKTEYLNISGVGFWDATSLDKYPTIEIATELNPATGKTEEWASENTVYTKEELDKAMQIAIKWAKAWKNYRGNEFGESK